MTQTVTVSTQETTTYDATTGNTNYVFELGSSVTLSSGLALDASGTAKNRSFEINGTLDGGSGVGAYLGDKASMQGGGSLSVGAEGVIHGEMTGIASYGVGQEIENAGTVQSGFVPVLSAGASSEIGNTGKIEGGATGVAISGDHSILRNSGEIGASSNGQAVKLMGSYDKVVNDLYIGSPNIGIEADGDHAKIVNHDSIQGEKAIVFNLVNSVDGALINTGSIEGSALAVQGSDQREVISNLGFIEGNLNLLGGDDTFRNRSGQVEGVVYGGKGNDTYVIDSAGLQLLEDAKGGHDAVKSSASFTLADNFETLQLTGKANITGIGSDGNNHLTGNAGKNILAGGLGGDILTGLGGADVFVFKTGDERDTITDFEISGKHHDVIDLIRDDIDGFAELKHHMSQHGDNVVIDFGGGDKLILDHVDIHDLSGKDFDF